MPQQLTVSVENNFTKGLITESTGLNFPENAATDTDNCLYTLIGDVTRRLGITRELNYADLQADRINTAISSYVWNNPGGDSNARLLVKQIGNLIYFYSIADSTTTSPLSNHLLPATVDISSFAVGGFDKTVECTYADGNGYLFIYHPKCDPVSVSYSSGNITSVSITLQVRDFTGVPDGLLTTSRPTTLSAEHQYNLINQGWTSGNPWAASSGDTILVSPGTKIFHVQTGITGINVGDYVQCINQNYGFPGGKYQPAGQALISGTVSSYDSASGQLIILPLDVNIYWNGSATAGWNIIPVNYGKISVWHSGVGNYPSNSDVWWNFKTSAGVFDPATTVGNIALNTGNGPRGHLLMNPFNQDRSALSGISGITVVSTTKRPSNGAWFAGRVWYTGVNANQAAKGDVLFYSWSENIYFSQVIQTEKDFGNCFQVNDPTSENLFDILPTDGGVINIPGTGQIFKLFPMANGMLVFAANGVWFITGSRGIGFAANDYTVTKLSSIKSISSTSFVDVQGLPYFWNEEGIYSVQAQQNGGSLSVEPITVGTILGFYNNIPFASKMYVRGAYNPIDYVIQWTYKSTQETSVTDRYQYNAILNFNVFNKAFYPYSLTIGDNQDCIHGVNYITYPSTASNTPEPGFKYGSSHFDTGQYHFQFAEEYATSYLDWGNKDYSSFFVTGYKLRGQAIKKFQPQYVQMWYRTNDGPTAYTIQGIWDYSNNRNSGRWSQPQYVDTGLSRYDTMYKRHKIRGRGYALQIKVSSVTGKPFDIQGWAIVDTVNQGV